MYINLVIYFYLYLLYACVQYDMTGSDIDWKYTRTNVLGGEGFSRENLSGPLKRSLYRPRPRAVVAVAAPTRPHQIEYETKPSENPALSNERTSRRRPLRTGLPSTTSDQSNSARPILKFTSSSPRAVSLFVVDIAGMRSDPTQTGFPGSFIRDVVITK